MTPDAHDIACDSAGPKFDTPPTPYGRYNPPMPPHTLATHPVVCYLEDNDILCYGATMIPCFDKEKGRISKGQLETIPIKERSGRWEKDTVPKGRNGIMMRLGARCPGDAQMNSGFLAVDIDTRNDETAETAVPSLWAALEPLCSCIVRTPSGGAHMYWRVPEGKRWKKALNLESITLDGVSHDTKGRVDVISGGGGILLPGSWFNYQGVRYEYEFMKGTSLADATLVPLPLIDFFDTNDIMCERKRIKLKRPAPSAQQPAAPLQTPPSAPSAPALTPSNSRSTTPLRVSDDDIRLMDKLCECLTAEWLEKYTNWRDLVFCLKSISNGRAGGRVVLLKHVARSPRHREQRHQTDTINLWETADYKGAIGWGSLHYWARLCSPDKHHQLFKDNYSSLIKEGNRGMADIFATELAGSCVYVSNDKMFWLWIEHLALWKPVCEDNIVAQYMRRMPIVIQKLINAYPKMPEDASAEEKEKHKQGLGELHKKKAEATNSMPEATIRCVRDALNPEVSFRNIDAFEVDGNPNYYPLANGVWNFKENRLEEYTRQHYISQRLPINYNPQADTSLIKEAMRLWFKGNKEHIDFVQYWFGYCLTGHITRQDFIILFGKSAGNGKSTFVEEILQEDILGKHFATTLGEDALSRVGGNNDDLYYAFGKRMCIAPESGGESKHTKELHLPTIKRITGGGRVAAEAKFKGKKEGTFTGKVVCICNEMPKMPNTIDNGTRRRTNVLEMNVKFLYPGEWEQLTAEEKASGDFGLRNPTFIRNLRANKEGTLLWLLEGAKRYTANPELDAPDSVKRYTAEALAGADTERQWFLDGWTFDKVKNKGQEVLFGDIASKWCEAFNQKPGNMVARGKFLRKIKAIVGEAYVTGDSNHGFVVHCLAEK